MKLDYGFVVAHSNIGFKNFIKYTLFHIKTCISDFESKSEIIKPDPAKYVLAKRLYNLYEDFKSKLTIDELEILDNIKYRNRDKIFDEEDYAFKQKVIYEKWEKVFFKKPAIYQDIDKTILGFLLSAIREENNITRAAVANATGYSYPRVRHFELGNTLPTLDFLYKFSIIFGCSIDELIKEANKFNI